MTAIDRKTTTAQACSDAMHANDASADTLGITLVEIASGYAKLRMSVNANMLNGHARCHGGFIFALADSAFAHACNSHNQVAFAAACSIDFLRGVEAGEELTAVAQERYLRGRTGIYDVDVKNGQSELVAVFRGKSFSTREPLLPDLES